MTISHIKSWKKIAFLLVLCDFLCVVFAYFMALVLRFDTVSAIPEIYFNVFWATVFFHAILAIFINFYAQLYNRVWQFVGYRELIRCLVAGSASIVIYFLSVTALVSLTTLFDINGRMPLSYFVFGGLFQMVLLVGSRFLWRLVKLALLGASSKKAGVSEPAMLIGGGSAGQLILRDLSTTTKRNIVFKCIIDDDPGKWGCYIEDVRVIGGRDRILEAVKDYGIRKIFVAIPTATALQKREILDICKESGCEVKILPGMYQFTDDEVSLSNMRSVSVDDLLGRDPIKVDEDAINKLLRGRVVLVTGAAGSIGSELCRLIAKDAPARLIALDINENGLFYLMQELSMEFPDVKMDFLLGSVREYVRMEEIFEKYHPEIVFHAAGHKHLTMMEASPLDAVKNNIAGTYNVAYAAMAHGCSKFILLSTDKAVNPVSILGASSRVCEILMQTMEHFAKKGEARRLKAPMCARNDSAMPDKPITDFESIRFGTVIGSEGSVFQVFRRQIEAGGPVLVTHPDVTRFCMSIKDTVHLILQATTYDGDGEVLVLDMGEPYSIDDIARRLIRLCGLVPESDIIIKYTGLRDGEKLREEPLMWEEGMRRTESPSIYVANPTKVNFEAFMDKLESFFKALRDNCNDVQSLLEDLCGSYRKFDAKSTDTTLKINEAPQEPIDNLGRIAARFDIPGEVIAAVPMNKGYINRTYRVDARQPDGSIQNFTLQRINTNVFKDAKVLMDNFAAVTTHLANTFRLPAHPDRPANQCLIRSRDGATFVDDASGSWRMLTYFPNVHSYDIPDSANVFRNSGMAFGTFLKAVSTLPTSSCVEVIPNFHNTAMRFEALEQAVAEDVCGRVASVKPELEFLRSHRSLFPLIANALEASEIPTRLCHNDCNLNNVLFEDGTNQPVAVIDLDTVMPATPLYDFGDSIRIGTNTACDDEKDLTKVSCNLQLLDEYARGWLGACGTMLTQREWELLPYAPLIITSEDGIRFLMDYIQGDKYYHTSYKGQNLDRARTQLRLLQDMETKLPKIKEIITNIANNIK